MVNLTKTTVLCTIKLRKRGDFVRTNYVYTVMDVASILRVSTKTVYKLIHEQALACIWVRGQIRITSEQLRDYLEGEMSHEKRNSGNMV